LSRQPHSEVAGAAGHIEGTGAGAEPGQGERKALPQPMRAARHQIVHQIVPARDRVEYLAHAPGLIFPVYFLVAEIRGRCLVRVQ